MLRGHNSNIFSIDWSADNRYLYSTGNDAQVLFYDVEHSQMPIRGAVPSEPQTRSPFGSMGGHDDSVPELSAHPTNPYLLLSCDDGGALKLLDIRLPQDSVGAARSDIVAGFSSVQWNPAASDGNTFAAATCGRFTGSTRLYDVRQCFSSDSDRPLTSKDAVLNFHTDLLQNSSTRGLVGAAAETNSLCFDPQGRFLASSISRYHPTIYAVNDPDPLATLESTVVEDPVDKGYREWLGVPAGTPAAPKKLSSCCTIKHGSFSLETHTGRLHYAIGSDDFRAYVFEIPDRAVLERQREFVNRNDWMHSTSQLHQERKPTKAQQQASQQGESNDDDDDDSDTVPESQIDCDSEVAYLSGGFQRGTHIVRPARIQKQAYELCGGRSIINTALIHPTMPLVFTSGIMTEVRAYSAAPLHAKDLYMEEEHRGNRDTRVGGTRHRMLLPPSLKFHLDSGSGSSSDEDGEDEEEDEERSQSSSEEDDDQSVSDDASSRQEAASSSIRHPEVQGAVDQPEPVRVDNQQVDGEEQPSGTVQDFLTSMRTDPLFSTGNTLDYQHDRHIGTYSLSHLSPGIVSEESSSPPSAPTAGSASATDADEGANTDATSEGADDAHDAAMDDEMQFIDDDMDDIADEDRLGDPYAWMYGHENESDIDWIEEQYMNDGYGDDDMLSFEFEERLEQDLRNAYQPEDEFRCSSYGKVWEMSRMMQYSNREQKRMRLFDELLNQDERKHLTSEFKKILNSAGGNDEAPDSQ